MGTIRSGLIIDEPWISLILQGEKTWEMRTSRTRKREWFGLIRKGSGSIVGLATVRDALGPLADGEIAATFDKHRLRLDQIRKWRFPWVLEDVVRLDQPIKYIHRGGVVWVTLDYASSEQAGAIDELLRQRAGPAQHWLAHS